MFGLWHASATPTVSALTYGGQTCTALEQGQGAERTAELWYLKNPPQGSNTLAPTYTNTTDAVVGCISVQNADTGAGTFERSGGSAAGPSTTTFFTAARYAGGLWCRNLITLTDNNITHDDNMDATVEPVEQYQVNDAGDGFGVIGLTWEHGGEDQTLPAGWSTSWAATVNFARTRCLIRPARNGMELTNSGSQTPGSSPFNFTCNGGDLLVALVHMRHATADPGVQNSPLPSYNSVTMSRADPQSHPSGISMETFYLTNPASGSNDFAWSYTTAPDAVVAGFMAFSNALQVEADVLIATSSFVFSPNTTMDRTVNTVFGGVMALAMGIEANEAIAPDDDQLERYETDDGVLRAQSSWAKAVSSRTSMGNTWTSNVKVHGHASSYVPANVPPFSPQSHTVYMFKKWQDFLRDLKRGLLPPDVLRKRYGDLYTI